MRGLNLRGAAPADAPVLADIINSVWPDSHAEPAQIRRALTASGFAAQVVLGLDDPVGFVAGFLTQDAGGQSRWEVDLLAVLPEHRRRGLGTDLITINSGIGLTLGGRRLRGLVALDNAASQHAFAHAGFRPAGAPAGLFVATPVTTTVHATLPPTARLIPVTTFTYTGLWLEGDYSPAALLAARSAGAALGVSTIGAVIPDRESAAQAAAHSAGYEQIGRFDWWQKQVAP